jgi:hypothetical protein
MITGDGSPGIGAVGARALLSMIDGVLTDFAPGNDPSYALARCASPGVIG